MIAIEIILNILYSLIGVFFMVAFIHMILSAFFEIWNEKRVIRNIQK